MHQITNEFVKQMPIWKSFFEITIVMVKKSLKFTKFKGFIVDFFFSIVENSIQKMQSKLAKDLRTLDSSLEKIKKEIPQNVLKMTMKEASQLKVLIEANVDENRQNLNVTVKETMSKADEGKFINFILLMLHYHFHHFHHLSLLFLYH